MLLQHQHQDREHQQLQLQEQGRKPEKVQQRPQLKRLQDISQSGGEKEELKDLWQEIMPVCDVFSILYLLLFILTTFITVFYPSYFFIILSYRL